jgi:hypothetical protein
VTASMAWPNFHRKMETEVDNQVAASAATRTPNLHRAKKSLIESADGRVATAWLWAQSKKRKHRKSRATAPIPSRRNGDRAVLAVKGSLRRKERALDRSGPLCTPSAMKEWDDLGKTNQNLLDVDRPSHGRPLHVLRNWPTTG